MCDENHARHKRHSTEQKHYILISDTLFLKEIVTYQKITNRSQRITDVVIVSMLGTCYYTENKKMSLNQQIFITL